MNIPEKADWRSKTYWLQNFFMWGFAGTKLPLLFYVRPSILEMNENRCVVKIKLRRRSMNHLKSMYFGAICIGVDACGGFLAFKIIRDMGSQVSLVFKDVKGDFVKRAESDVYFVCDDGPAIREMVTQTMKDGERVNRLIAVNAFVKNNGAFEPVANFTTTLSLKKIRPRA